MGSKAYWCGQSMSLAGLVLIEGSHVVIKWKLHGTKSWIYFFLFVQQQEGSQHSWWSFGCSYFSRSDHSKPQQECTEQSTREVREMEMACPSCCQEGHADPRFDPRAITLTPYVCWVCLWFFSLYRGLLFFLVSPPFSIHKIQHSNFHFTWKLTLQHYILSGSSGWEHTQCGCPQPNAIFLRFVFGEFPWPSASDSTTCMFSWRSISTNKFWNVVVSECVY